MSIDDTLPAHSTLGASSAKRWFNCPGSVALVAQCPPQVGGAAAQEGTNAHELAEKVLKETPNAFYYVGKDIFPFKVTKTMAEHVQTYVDFVRNVKNELKGELQVEKKFHLKHLHPKLFGTGDAVVVQPFGEIHVIDFKYGAGIPVEVEENEQLLYYGLGASHGEDFETMRLTVVQPRAPHSDGPIRSWKTDAAFIRNFSKKLRQKALETEKEDAPLKAGEWCRFCPAAGVCPQLHRASLEIAKADFAAPTPTLPLATALSDEQVVRIIEHKKLFTNWLDAVEKAAFERMQNGEQIPGLKLVRKRGSREWTDEKEATKILRGKLGEDAFERKLLSVAKAEKKVGKDSIAHLFQAVEGGLTIAPESDRRQEVIKARDDFAASTESDNAASVGNESVSLDDF